MSRAGEALRAKWGIPSRHMKYDIDFTITDELQRLEMWSVVARRTGIEASAVMQTAQAYAAALLVPVCGNAVQRPGTFGFDTDGAMFQRGAFRFAARTDLEHVIVSGWLPTQHSDEVDVTVTCEDASISERVMPGSQFAIRLPLHVVAGSEHELEIELSASFQPSALPGGSNDTRRLGCIIQAVEFT
jgi:hypothetical protein